MHAVPPPAAERRAPWRGALVPFAVAVVAFAAYAATAARGITWWDGGSYPLAAVTLGIPGAPGSLLLTVLGWIVSLIPIVDPVAFRLNLFAALLAATLVGIVSWLGARLATPEGAEPGFVESVCGAAAGLTLAFGVTLWTYATQFTPYVLTALWTALILAVALLWWRRPESSTGRGLLFLLFLILGLDFSVHRTNLLILPAVVLWVVIRTPASGSWVRDAMAAVGGMVAGLAFHLLLIPMAARNPAYHVEDTSTLAGWWNYVTVARAGGGFLVDLFPRRAAFVSVQIFDWLAFLARNLSPVAYLPAVLIAIGGALALPRHPRRTLAWLAFLLCAGLGAVLYFNRPVSYMRSLDRHYLPSLIVAMPFMAVGAATLLRATGRSPALRAVPSILACVLLLIPVAAWRMNVGPCDLSRWRFAESFARDMLEPLPEHAILLTNGDNDSFPLWCAQQLDGVRRDVLVLNLPLANTGLCIARLRQADPALARLLEGEGMEDVLVPLPQDLAVTTEVDRTVELGLPSGVPSPDSVAFLAKAPVYAEDRVVLDLLRLTSWRRPLYLASTVTRDHLSWLWPYARLDGLAYRIIPSADPLVWDVDHFRTQLLDRVRFAGLAKEATHLDPDTAGLWRNYAAAFFQLVSAEVHRGRAGEAQATLDLLEARVDPIRLGLDQKEFDSIRSWVESQTGPAPPNP